MLTIISVQDSTADAKPAAPTNGTPGADIAKDSKPVTANGNTTDQPSTNGVNATTSPPKSPPIDSAKPAEPAPTEETKMDAAAGDDDEMKLVGDQSTADQQNKEEPKAAPVDEKAQENKGPEGLPSDNAAPESAPSEKASEKPAPENEQPVQDGPKPTDPAEDTKMENAPPAPQESVAVKTELPHHPPTQPNPQDTPDNDSTAAPPTLPAQDVDREMPDAPQPPMSPSKVTRERETDASEEPAAKRTKVEGEATSAEFKVPELPTPTTEPPAESPMETKPNMTRLQHKFLLKGIQTIKRMPNARFYKEPVDPIKLNIPHYPNVIKNPMDLGTIEAKLKNNEYAFPQGVIDDFYLMVQNSLTFNGPDHIVAQEGQNLKGPFEKLMVKLPKPDEVEEKKPKKAPQKTSAARREPRTSTGRTAPPAGASPQPTTFALSPEGLPLIRRDSTNADGRPKRSIHPPKRDLPYSTKPKKKQFQWELRFCQEVLDELHKSKHFNYASPFYYPVDPVALNIPTYHNVIKKPMDLSTMQSKLKTGQYENSREFEVDMRQMFKNCFKFNIPGDPTFVAGQTLESVFNTKWANKARYLEAHEPHPEQHTSSSEESSEEEADDSDDSDERVSALQKKMAELSREVEAITSKKKKTPPSSKKAAKSKSGKKDSKKSKPPSSGKKDKKSKSTKVDKDRWVTYHEKQLISNGISSLPDKKMQEALKIIQSNVPSLKVCPLIPLFQIDLLIPERVHKRPRLNLILTSFPMMSCSCS